MFTNLIYQRQLSHPLSCWLQMMRAIMSQSHKLMRQSVANRKNFILIACQPCKMRLQQIHLQKTRLWRLLKFPQFRKNSKQSMLRSKVLMLQNRRMLRLKRPVSHPQPKLLLPIQHLRVGACRLLLQQVKMLHGQRGKICKSDSKYWGAKLQL